MADPYKDKVVLFLPMEGSHDGSTVFNDRTGKTVTVNGNTHLSTDVAPPWGKTSAYFDGSGDYLTTDSLAVFRLGAGNFTFEGRFYFTDVSALNTSRCLLWLTDGSGNLEVGLSLTSAAKLSIKVYHTSAYQINAIGGTTLTTGQWYHLAFTRQGAVHTGYINGVVETSASASHTFPETDIKYVSGYTLNATYPGWFAGYAKDLRITKGLARYTGNFHVDNKPLDWNTPEQPRIII